MMECFSATIQQPKQLEGRDAAFDESQAAAQLAALSEDGYSFAARLCLILHIGIGIDEMRQSCSECIEAV